ncbi:MAG TPA: hypothetical protein PKM65_20225 [Spirochaetota bacterium]|nr:hypothetical protein [Spirochaetota bacterium]
MVDGLPERKFIVSPQDVAIARLSQPFVLMGSNPSLVGENIIVFLEYVAHGGSLVVKDASSTALTGTITETLDLTASPLRVDGGVILTATVKIAKGFYVVVK